ncbi:hypothetical protein MFIFM68171_02291 [Madurella fahalii]|uniref:Rhodopsin domain-containing protein n=1 Tax=Madurella fahalii TaxID=1157608 RepID=A0ABQ0G2U3_9PEZI
MSTVSGPAAETQSKRAAIIAISVAFPTLSSLVVSLRLYTRLRILGVTGSDDWVIVAALLLAIGASIEIILEANWGLGLHLQAVSPDMLAEQMKELYASIITYNLANNVVKMSFLLQYRRIFGMSSFVADSICHWLFIFVAVWAVVQAILLGISCFPAAAIMSAMADKCLDTMPVWYFSSVLHVVTDFLIFLIPLPCVYRMSLPKNQKAFVCSIFCLGFFVCIISIIRLCYLRIVFTTEDAPWDNTELTLWSVVELNCGILCASLQTLRPLLSKCLPGITSGSNNNCRVLYHDGGDTALINYSPPTFSRRGHL